MIRDADHAMYEAKESGRNQYRRFDPSAGVAPTTRRLKVDQE